PQASPRDRKTGRSESGHRQADHVLEYIASAAQVVAKLLGRLLIHDPVPKAMTTDFMTGGMNRADQGGEAFCHPTEDEECAAHPVCLKQVQDYLCARNHSRFQLVPFRSKDTILKAGDLVIVLHVDGYGIED